jgi:RNA-directed DNA polymerase
VGVDLRELKVVDLSYTDATIPKRTGGLRYLRIPNDRLKSIQHSLAARCLNLNEPSSASYAYVKRRSSVPEFTRSNVTHALEHVGSDVVVRLDLRNFFDSIDRNSVSNFLTGRGLTEQAASLFISLCFAEDGGLPQGSPTSPALSNLVTEPMDAELGQAASTLGCRFTRYSDDLTFSWSSGSDSRSNPARPKVGRLLHDVQQIVEAHGHRVNRSKTRVMRKGHRQIVGGLIVNDQLNTPREQRRLLRSAAYNIANSRSTTFAHDQLNGHLVYAAHVRKIAAL